VTAIGLHSREIIADDQFTASSSWSSQHAPSAARINDEAGLLLLVRSIDTKTLRLKQDKLCSVEHRVSAILLP